MYKRNKKNKRIVLLLIGLFLLVMAFMSTTLKGDKKLNSVESLFKDAVSSVMKLVYAPLKYIHEKYNNYKELDGIRKKYQLIQDEAKRIDQVETENIELRRQMAALKKELDIKNTLNDYAYLNATVIYHDVTSWFNEITIDKGSKNGVEEDMVVVNSMGLIGKVTATSNYTSTVRLITANTTNNKISIVVSDGKNNTTGLISKYNREKGILEVEGVSNTVYVSEGAYVYTSGLGGIFPSGILIGIVDEIKTDEYGLAKLIDVKPVADFNDINYVAVLKRKELTP